MSYQCRWLRLIALTNVLLVLCAGAAAHPTVARAGSLNVIGSRVYFVVTLTALDFKASGQASGGRPQTAQASLTPKELAAHFERAVSLHDGEQVAQWKEVVALPAHDDADQVLVTSVAEFARLPRTLGVTMGLLGAQEAITLRATRTQNERSTELEVGLISKNKPQFVFFARWWQRLAEFAQEGFGHIMGGWDHLLFLVALLATGMTVRRWAGLLTGFTLAHGLTFGLASLDWVQAPAALVEPAIAASIALVACLHLLGVRMRLRWELALVMALGLIHGLGFASALQESGPSLAISAGAYPVLAIVGFNLGVEAGQAAVAAALFILVRALHYAAPQARHLQWQRALSAMAATVACYWLFQRI